MGSRLKIVQDVKDYINFLFKNGYKVIVDPKKIYFSKKTAFGRDYLSNLLRFEIFEWTEENNIYCRFKKVKSESGFAGEITSVLTCEVEFLHMSDAILFKLWLS